MGRPTWFPYPGGERALTSGALVFYGLTRAFMAAREIAASGSEAERVMKCVWAGVLVALGIALWCRKPWARVPGVLVTGLLAIAQGWQIALLGGSLSRWALLAGFLSLAWGVYSEWSPAELAAADEAEGPGKPLVSLVLLLRKPRHLEATMLARYCEAAWGGSFATLREGERPADEEPTEGRRGWVGGTSPMLLVGTDDGMFVVHNHGQPYFDEPGKLADGVGDLRVRQVLEENRAWMAVDAIAAGNGAGGSEAQYRLLARLVAELSGPDCQAIYQPDGNRFNHWDEALEARLRAGDLEGVFGEPTRVPVIEVPDDDPRMKAAVEEALRTWPEFVGAVERGEGESHTVKVPVRHGDNTEYIWVEVDRIEDGTIHGRLGNDPVDLGDLRLGSAVQVASAEVRDWMYLLGGKMKGGFGVKVIAEIERERRARPA